MVPADDENPKRQSITDQMPTTNRIEQLNSEENVAKKGFFVAGEHVADNPKLGVFWYIMYTVKMVAILYMTKGIYILNPDI
jgi:hypothetical protein